MKLLNTHSDKDKIIRHLQGDDSFELSDALLEKLKRYECAADLIKQYGTRHKVVPMLIKIFGISKRAAYLDFEETQEVFGTSSKNSKNFYIDMIFGMMVETRKKAYAKNDFKTAATVEKNMTDLVQGYFGDKDTPDYSLVQPPSFFLGFFPEELKTELPADWEEQAKKFVINQNAASIVDAEVISENGKK